MCRKSIDVHLCSLLKRSHSWWEWKWECLTLEWTREINLRPLGRRTSSIRTIHRDSRVRGAPGYYGPWLTFWPTNPRKTTSVTPPSGLCRGWGTYGESDVIYLVPPTTSPEGPFYASFGWRRVPGHESVTPLPLCLLRPCEATPGLQGVPKRPTNLETGRPAGIMLNMCGRVRKRREDYRKRKGVGTLHDPCCLRKKRDFR